MLRCWWDGSRQVRQQQPHPSCIGRNAHGLLHCTCGLFYSCRSGTLKSRRRTRSSSGRPARRTAMTRKRRRRQWMRTTSRPSLLLHAGHMCPCCLKNAQPVRAQDVIPRWRRRCRARWRVGMDPACQPATPCGTIVGGSEEADAAGAWRSLCCEPTPTNKPQGTRLGGRAPTHYRPSEQRSLQSTSEGARSDRGARPR